MRNVGCVFRAAGVVIATATLMSSTARAGVGRWTTNGPNAPSISNLSSSPAGVVYLAAGTGFFKNGDGGATWTNLPEPNPDGGASSIVVDPRSPSTLYALEGGIYRSSDGGATWTEPDPGFGVSHLAIDPSSSTLYGWDYQSIYKSTDGGAHWVALDTSHFGMQLLGNIGTVACHPKRPGTVYVTVNINEDAGLELWQSDDSGASWTQLSLGPGQRNYRYLVWSVFGDPSSGSTTYAILDTGFFKSTDGGKTWINQFPSTTGRTSTLVIDPTNPSRLYFSNSGTLYNGSANAESGLFLSTDGGTAWTPLGNGLPEAGISSLVIDSSRAWLYAGTGAGVFKSTDFGVNWSGPAFIPTGSNVLTVATVRAQPNVLFAGTDHGFYRSADGGKSWQESGMASEAVKAIVIDTENSTRMYAAAGFAIMKSLDSGRTWSPASNGLSAFPQQGVNVSTIAIDPKTPSTLYTFEYTSFEFYKTTDGAENWIPTSLKEDINTLTIDPIDPEVIYAGRFGQFEYGHDVLIKSTDGAKSWAASQNGLPFPGAANAIAMDPKNHTVLYAGTNKGVFKSSDSALTWKATGSVPGLNDVSAIAIDPVSTANVYAGTYDRGVYRSNNGGLTWTELNAGLTNRNVQSLAIDPAGRFLFAATAGGGVFAYEIPAGPIDLTVGTDEATRLLSIDENDSSLTVERVDPIGSISRLGPLGPYSGWTARATAGSGPTRILWNRDDGSAALSQVSDAAITATFRYPAITGLSAIDVAAAGPETHILWTGADGKALVQTVDGSGGITKTLSFGPYAGWQATAISDGPDGLTRILWNNVNGSAGVSVVHVDGSLTTNRFGPAAGWTALDIATGGDGLTRLLWSNLDGRVVLGILDAGGSLLHYGETQTSESGLSPTRLASGPSGTSRILFNGANGAASLWIMSAAGERQREILLSPGPPLDLSGAWTGLFQTRDSADCHSDPAANAAFSQNGSKVTGTITTIANTCGFGGDFEGTLNGRNLTGTLTKGESGQTLVSGFVSDTGMSLTVGNMFIGNREIPGGTLDLHPAWTGLITYSGTAASKCGSSERITVAVDLAADRLSATFAPSCYGQTVFSGQASGGTLVGLLRLSQTCPAMDGDGNVAVSGQAFGTFTSAHIHLETPSLQVGRCDWGGNVIDIYR